MADAATRHRNKSREAALFTPDVSSAKSSVSEDVVVVTAED